MEQIKSKFSDAQREILEAAYANGLMTTSDKFSGEFYELSVKTGLDVPTIKVWINNRKRREKRKLIDHPGDSGEETSFPKKIRKDRVFRQVSGHNLFCSSLWSGELSSLSMSERSKEAHQRWNCLDPEEKEKWKRQAERINTYDLEDLPLQKKKRVTEASIKRLMAEIELLSSFGWSGFYVLIDEERREIKHFAAPDSVKFLMENSNILESYSKFHVMHQEKIFSQENVRDMLNDKYYRTFGKKNVEYRKFKKDFTVRGWPEGVTFKQPYDYGKNQIKLIMESEHLIEFVKLSDTCRESDQVPYSLGSNEENYAVQSTLEASNESVTLNQKATNCEATKRIAVSKPKTARAKPNSFARKGDILPCLTDSRGYWLFKCLSKVKTNGKIKGKWYDTSDEPRHFFLLKDIVEIDEMVVITKENKRMVLPISYFDEIGKETCTLSLAAHSLILDLTNGSNRKTVNAAIVE